MNKQWTLDEIKVFLSGIIKKGGFINIQRHSNDVSPRLAMNLRVSRCVTIHNGIQFHVAGGYINIEFDEGYEVESDSAELFSLEFHEDFEERGYRLFFGDFHLFMPRLQFEQSLKELESEVLIQQKKDQTRRTEKGNADRHLDKAFWDSIDNMLED